MTIKKAYENMMKEMDLILLNKDSQKEASDQQKRIKMVALWNHTFKDIAFYTEKKHDKLLALSICGMICKTISDQLTAPELYNHMAVIQHILGL